MKPLTVKDNLLNPTAHKLVDEYVRDGAWKPGWKSDSKRDIYSFWHKHYAGTLGTDHPGKTFDEPYDCATELKELHPLLHQFWQFLSRDHLKNHMLVRCYANCYPYGTEGTLHTDLVNPKSFTSVYYPHQHWSPNWGGETVFFNKEETDIIACIYAKPNRMVSFSGVLPHVARGVSKTCIHNRITVMFKSQDNG